jgi:hypothetical protein
VGGACSTAARYRTIASLALAVDVEGLELADQLLSQVLGTVAMRDLLIHVVVACQAPRIGGAGLDDLLESWLERKLHKYTLVAAVSAFGALALGVADDNVIRVLCARG